MPGIPESRRALPELTSVRQENDHPATSTRLKPTGGNLGIPLMLVIITALSFAVFPGHSWLQIDSQIYVAIMLHQEHPDILAKDPVAVHSHTAGTLYDEI